MQRIVTLFRPALAILCLAGAAVAAAPAAAQETVPATPDGGAPLPRPAPQDGEGARGESQPPSLAVVTPQEAPDATLPPDAEAPREIGRFLVDSGVSDVRLGEGMTVVTMNAAPQSACPSNAYVYERDRPKWLVQTGRLMQAMKEGARLRVSFSCRDGLQSINAIQFLSPPRSVAQTLPRREDSVEAEAARQARSGDEIPLPADGAGGQEGSIPLP